MEKHGLEIVGPQFTAMAISWLILWFSIDWLLHAIGIFADWMGDYLEGAVAQSMNRPSHVPGLTLCGVRQRRYMRRHILKGNK